MTRSTSTALGLALALTLSTGSVLMKHPSPEDKAPGGYSDIMIAADDNQPVIPPQSGDKQPTGAAIGTPSPTLDACGVKRGDGCPRYPLNTSNVASPN
jgi:hypothetical protein